LSEDDVAEVGGGGKPLFRDMELEEAVEVGAGGTAGRGVVCKFGAPKMELEVDDIVAVFLEA
jgi:hypothetical protein